MAVKIIESKIVDINTLRKHEDNPRFITKENFDGLKKNIQNIGFLDPIIVNTYPGREGVICAGNQRYEVLKSLGETNIEIKEVYLSPNDEKKFLIAHNNLTGRNDRDILSELLYKLQEDGENVYDIGFSEADINNLIDNVSTLESEQYTEQAIDDIMEDSQSLFNTIYRVYIDSDDSILQEQIYDKLSELGFNVQKMEVNNG